MDTVRVEVDDLMQQSYVYLLTDPIGRTAPSLSGLDEIENLRGVGPNWKSGSQRL